MILNFSSPDFALLGKIISERKPQAVALDENQDIEGWELFVNGLLNRGYAVFVTGSNAKMLSRELGTKLTDDNTEREFEGLVSAAKRLGLKSGVIVTCRQSDEAIHDGCEISIVPAYDYLLT